MDSEDTVKEWLKQLLKMDNLEKYSIKISDNDDKCGGYMSRIFFISLKHKKENSNSNLDLAIKLSTANKEVGATYEIANFFLRENFIYENVFPLFSKLEEDKGVEEKFNSYPKYYGNLFLENVQIIALENIKETGFKLSDRKNGMDFQHCQLVLKAYAKLHSLSFALKDQDREAYEALTRNVDDIFTHLLLAEHSKQYMKCQRDEVLDCLEKKEDEELYKKYKEEFENFEDMCISLLLDKDEKVAFLHGDNWSNNFMFKYEENEPVSVSIVDWQLSSLRSPVFDISRFLFSVCREKELNKLEDLLKYYYACFEEHLTKLGSDPEKLFSLSDFKKHWKRYWRFGLIGSTMIMKLAVLDENEAPSIENLENGSDYNKVFNMAISGKELYYQRMKEVILAYFEIKTNKTFFL